MKIEPFDIIKAASIPDGKGGIDVDMEALAVALITVSKVAHMSKADCLRDFARMWDEIEITAHEPGVHNA